MEDKPMNIRDVMTTTVVSVEPEASILEAVGLMLRQRISGLPVVDRLGNLRGIVTEGDFLRRAETATQRRRPRWIEFLIGPGRLATEYVHTAGRRVDEVMTTRVQTIAPGDSLEEAVRRMERHGVKRLPVVENDRLVGIVTRSNLMRALISAATRAHRTPASTDDEAIRTHLRAELDKQPWAPIGGVDFDVRDGVVTLYGVIADDRLRQALCVAAENTPGVRHVDDQVAWMIPTAAVAGTPPYFVPPDRPTRGL
jgi:CBS domain-containing protein